MPAHHDSSPLADSDSPDVPPDGSAGGAYTGSGEAHREARVAMNSARRSWKPLWVSLAVITWLAGIGAGSWYGLQYEITPAEKGQASEQWPTETLCGLSASRPTLVMFVHPRCPCSRASMDELALLMKNCASGLAAQVLFIVPPGQSADWASTELWRSAGRIPGLLRRLDPGGSEQRRFGARASGEVFLYRPDGELSFHGGITAGRGHGGDNRGRAAIESLVRRDGLPTDSTLVFGCSLVSPACRIRQMEVDQRGGAL